MSQGLDQPTPDEWPWWKVIPFCLFIAPLIILAVTIFAGVILAVVVNVLGS